MQLYFGLEDTIRKQTHKRMLDICTKLLRDVLSQEDIAMRVEKRLWMKELKDDIRVWFRDHMATEFWDTVLDIIATVHGSVDGQKSLADIQNNPSRRSRLMAKILGDAQWIQLWNEALSAALPAARDAVRNQARPDLPVSTEFHEEIYRTAFTAANDAALAAAKNVVKRTEAAQNNPKRAQMWETVWEVWDDMWKISHEKTRVIVVPIFEQPDEKVEDIATLVIDRVLATVRGSQAQKMAAWVQYSKGKRSPLSTSEFQEQIGRFVKSAYPTAGQRAEEINAAMGRALDTASNALRLGL